MYLLLGNKSCTSVERMVVAYLRGGLVRTITMPKFTMHLVDVYSCRIPGTISRRAPGDLPFSPVYRFELERL